MQAKNIRPGIHSIKGKNVAKVRNWRLLTEVVFTDGTRRSYFPTANVKVQPARNSDGTFIPRNYLIMAVIDGFDVVFTVEGRNIARQWLAGFRTGGDTATMIAL